MSDGMDDPAANGLSFDLLAASLRADQADMHTWVAVLGAKLADALPTRVQLYHGGLFGSGPVVGLVADLGTYRFALRQEHGQPYAERTHTVRGIALKTEPLALDSWLASLSQELAQLAAASAHERAAIERLLS